MKPTQDPITMELMWQRVINIAEEGWVTIWRTSFSVVVGEALDYGYAILDPQGRVLAHPSKSMPAFNFTLPNAAKAVLRRYPAETMLEGDVFITNDPWLLSGHLFDVAVMTPVFNRHGKVVAVMGSVAHVADIGGTRSRHTVREIYDEGLFIPPLKFYDRGQLNDQLIELIENNVRLSPMVLGDMHAMVSANKVGGERVLAFMGEYGLSDLEELTTEVQTRTERVMREAISALPDGVYDAEQWSDRVEEAFKYRAQVKVSGDTLEVEFLDVPPQFPYGGTNLTQSMLKAYIVYLCKCILVPGVPGNDGDFRPLSAKAPEGSVFNCTRPAAVNQRTRTSWTIPPAVMRALAPIIPEKVQAHTGYPIAIKAYGSTGKGEVFNDHMFQAGGQGASSRGDGQTTVCFPTSAGNVSVEMFEMRTGLLIEEKEFIPDSAGPGKFRGAPGQRVTIRRGPRETGGQYLVQISPPGLHYDTPGLVGGKAARRTRLYSQAAPGEPIKEFYGGIFLDLDDTMKITLELLGGSGFGDPKERDPEAIRKDITEDLLTPEGARTQYDWEDSGI